MKFASYSSRFGPGKRVSAFYYLAAISRHPFLAARWAKRLPLYDNSYSSRDTIAARSPIMSTSRAWRGLESYKTIKGLIAKCRRLTSSVFHVVLLQKRHAHEDMKDLVLPGCHDSKHLEGWASSRVHRYAVVSCLVPPRHSLRAFKSSFPLEASLLLTSCLISFLPFY